MRDREDQEGQATCEGGDHLPMIGLLSATLARIIQDFVRDGARRDGESARRDMDELTVTDPSRPSRQRRIL